MTGVLLSQEAFQVPSLKATLGGSLYLDFVENISYVSSRQAGKAQVLPQPGFCTGPAGVCPWPCSPEVHSSLTATEAQTLGDPLPAAGNVVILASTSPIPAKVWH